MSNESKIQCCARVYSGFYAHQCKNTGGLEHGGKNYCKAHHPPTIEAKQKAKHDKWQSAHKARMQVFDKAVAYDLLLAERDKYRKALDVLSNLHYKDEQTLSIIKEALNENI